MADTAKQLAQVAPATGSNNTAYTVPAATTTIVKELLICNPQVSAGTIEAWVVPNGGTATDATKILHNLTIASGETKFVTLTTVMGPLGTFVVKSTTAQVTYTLSGVELT